MEQILISSLSNKRMGHMSLEYLLKVSKKEVVRHMLKIIKPLNFVCKHRLHGKQTEVRFKTYKYSTSNHLECVSTNLCGPTMTKNFQGEVLFYYLHWWLYKNDLGCFLKKKYKEFEKFKAFKALVENETDLKIKHLRSDNGGEFPLDEFN